MGSHLSTVYHRCLSLCCFRRNIDSNTRERLLDIEEGKTKVVTSIVPKKKRRALLVGISYAHIKSDTWWPLENPHQDVDLFWNLLVGVYGYAPEDITVLKDAPNFPELKQPTRDNMTRELTRLVSGAASGDRFTFFYSGHSDQQISLDDICIEEDGQDEVIITSDLERIIDNELNDILVKPLPVGCSLLAVLDTCHSGTMLDLPHHYCNSVYVPWLSKGDRSTLTLRNNIVRHHAMGLSGLRGSVLPSLVGMIAQTTDNSTRSPTEPLSSSSPRLKIDTQVRRSADDGFWRRKSSGDSEAYPAREGRRSKRSSALLSPTRYDSPVSSVACNGWCGYDVIPGPLVLSLSACSDPQRAWEGPRGSLTTLLCKYLEKQPRPTYRDLMSHVNFALHENARELHKFTRDEKKKKARGEGNGFDGELDNFQEPNLSSLSKLNMDDIFQL